MKPLGPKKRGLVLDPVGLEDGLALPDGEGVEDPGGLAAVALERREEGGLGPVSHPFRMLRWSSR
jgi:hypothetical protein